MSELDLGTKVEYLHKGKWRKGEVFAVRKVPGKRNDTVTGYLVDTGKTHLEGEIETPKGEDNIPYSQPVQVEVGLDEIRPLE